MSKQTLEDNLNGINASIQKTQQRLSMMVASFWKNGGTCCPDCGYPGYTELSIKFDRMKEFAKELEIKIILKKTPPLEPTDVDMVLTHGRAKERALLDSFYIASNNRDHQRAGDILSQRYRVIARTKKRLRQIDPTNPIGHLQGDPFNQLGDLVFTTPPEKDLPLFGQ